LSAHGADVFFFFFFSLCLFINTLAALTRQRVCRSAPFPDSMLKDVCLRAIRRWLLPLMSARSCCYATRCFCRRYALICHASARYAFDADAGARRRGSAQQDAAWRRVRAEVCAADAGVRQECSGSGAMRRRRGKPIDDYIRSAVRPSLFRPDA